MTLQFLEFDFCEDSEGLCTWDALASPAASHTPALLAEVHTLLQHLLQQLGPAGPVDDGHAWDMDLHIHDEAGHPMALQAHPPAGARVTLSLSLTGGPDLATLWQ